MGKKCKKRKGGYTVLQRNLFDLNLVVRKEKIILGRSSRFVGGRM